MKDRVLGKHGFEPFPKRLEEQAIKHGAKDAPADTGIDEPLLKSNAVAKRELAIKMNEEAKAQAEMDKVIKERAAKKAKEEKEIEDEKARERIKDVIESAATKAKKI